jgi:Domain of unknown function (DUF5060)/Protein of unknown function (DUF4038)
MLGRFGLVLFAIMPALAQTPCEGTLAYSPCELSFRLSAADLAAHPNPYRSVDLHAEFRSPRFNTYLMPAFWDGAGKMVLRFTPTEPGKWIYRITSNLAALDGKEGSFNAAPSDSPGFVNAANVHHWATDNKQPHLWMGYIADRFPFEPEQQFEQQLDQAAGNRFNHFRGSILGDAGDRNRVYLGPDKPNPAYFDELDRRVLAIQKRGITADLMLASNPDYVTSLFPDWQARERFIRYVVARYAPMNITWQGLEEFEDYAEGRTVLKEMGTDLMKMDPYHHPRSSNAKISSSPLLADGWMTFVIEASPDDTIGSVEHQFYQVPFIGVTGSGHLWNVTMDGEYPEVRAGGDLKPCGYWFDFLSKSRYWELEPYFDVDGTRAVALEDVEYLNYIEHPGPPVEVTVEKHGYDVEWLNPSTGETIEQKNYKGEHFTSDVPDESHPWVLWVARQGHLESMLKSYKLVSRDVPLVQTIEANPQKVPYVIAEPSVDAIPCGKPVRFSAKLTRETRATREMMYLWTAEVASDGRGFRVLGTGSSASFAVPPSIAARFPAVLNVRLTALNAYGKAYTASRVYQLTQ